MHDRELLPSLLVHDMRQPLQAIQSFLQIVLAERTGPLNDRQRDFLITTYSATQRLARLVEDFEHLVSQSPTLQILPEAIDLHHHVMSCIAELQPLSDSREVELCLVTDGGPWQINADPLRLDQILLNLIENAILYSPSEGTVSIRLRATQGRILCVVENETVTTGSVSIENWWEPKVRYAPTVGREPGRGLGLAVVRYLVDTHGWHRIGRLRDGVVSLGFTLSRHEAYGSDSSPIAA